MLQIKTRVVRHLPLLGYQVLYGRRSLSLTYHMVSDATIPSVRHLYPYKTISMFERDLIFLKRWFRPVSYEQLRSGRRAPWNAVLLTFDDGYKECASIVKPMLLKYGFPCVFFVVSGLIDNKALFYRNKVSLCIEAINSAQSELVGAQQALSNLCGRDLRDREALVQWLLSLAHADEPLIDTVCEFLGIDWRQHLEKVRPYLTSEEIRLLAKEGFTIGAHSINHPDFTTLSNDEVEEQIVMSCRMVQRMTGQIDVPFAFPYCAAGIPRDFLQDLKRKYDWLGTFFDCLGIGGDISFLMDRLEADRPSEQPTRNSNLSVLLKAAYRDYFTQTKGGTGIGK
jgi:peptidoglycan/xylan/chitin deacetylase (PgdA/CDA1 family)